MATPKPIEMRQVRPAVDRDEASQRPTEMRYAWCPFGDINLSSPSGTPALYVQPHEIEVDGKNVPNDYHRLLPKGQLIPFPTFNALEQMPSPDQTDAQGRAVLISDYRTMTALDAVNMVLRNYSGWGFTVLYSLQGLDQEKAMRIFQVVQPFEYPLSKLVNELAFGAQERIDSTEPLTFPDFPGYVVQPLQDEKERKTARQLASEMEAGAEIAFSFATETLDATEASMTQRFAGGQGKTGGDSLDRRLSDELDRELPKLGGGESKTANIEQKLDYLVDREAVRSDKEEIARLKAENEALRSQEPPKSKAKAKDTE